MTFYVIAPQLKYFKSSIATIQTADFALVALGLAFVAITYLAAAGSYWFLAPLRPSYWRMAFIEVADGFTNRLLPAGAGGIATNVVFLSRRNGKVKAGLVVGLNNLIGFIGHIALLVLLLLLGGNSGKKSLNLHFPYNLWWAVAILVSVIIVGWFFRSRFTAAPSKKVSSLTSITKFAFGHPKRIMAALGCSLAVTIGYALALYMVMLALNVHLTFLQAFLVLTVGVAATAATPTPGGLGGVEAGIVAAQISMGVANQQALSVALVYRVLTYWLPLLPGLIAFRVALSRRYLII